MVMTNPAALVIGMFGGAPKVADLCGLNESSVYRWTYPKERGGLDGIVPARHQRTLLREAPGLGVPLTPDHFHDHPSLARDARTLGEHPICVNSQQ
jgi:hypothetical protein